MGRGSVVAHYGLMCALFACSDPAADNPCPAAARPDPARAERLHALLEDSFAQRYLSVSHTICFGAGLPGVVTDEGVVLLSSEDEDRALAARLAHLIDHIVRPPLRSSDVESCERLALSALSTESLGYSLEIRLRDHFGLGAAPYTELEQAFRQDAEIGIFRWLVAHPEGGPGVDALGRSYRERCEATRERDAQENE